MNDAPIIARSTINNNFDFFFNPNRILLDKVMYGIFPQNVEPILINALLSSCYVGILLEIFGTYGLGEGALFIAVYNLNNISIIHPSILTPALVRQLEEVFSVLCHREIKPIFDEVTMPDRRALDDVVFDALGLTAGEREAVYEAVVELVRRRLEKARSV